MKRNRKEELVNYNELSKKSKNDVVFIKQIQYILEINLKKLKAIDEKVKFIKQIPVKTKKKTMKNKEDLIPKDNVSKLMRGEFDLNPKKQQPNKTPISDTKKIDEEIIMDMIIDALNDKTNEFYVEHSVGSNYFTLKLEDG